LVDLARAFPDQTIVINHVGGVSGTGPYLGRKDEVMQMWRKGVERAASCHQHAQRRSDSFQHAANRFHSGAPLFVAAQVANRADCCAWLEAALRPCSW